MTARDGNQAVRSWQEIAKELTREMDSQNFERLAGELLEALQRSEALQKSNAEQPRPSSKPANRSECS